MKNLNIAIILVLLLSNCGKKIAETKPVFKDITETVFASGVLEANNTYNLVAQTDGYILQINYREGEVITAGQTFAVIENLENNANNSAAQEQFQIAITNAGANSATLSQAKFNINTSKIKMAQDAVNEQRMKKLWEENAIAKNDYEQALLNYTISKNNYEVAVANFQKLQNDLNQSLISSKNNAQIQSIANGKNALRIIKFGKILERLKEPGDYVKRGEIIAVIGNPNFIYAKINVDENNISKIKLGQKAIVQLNTNTAKTYNATVFEIAPSFDNKSQTYICKLRFIDSLDFSIVKTQLQANIITGITKNAMLIPRNYLDFGGNVILKNKQKIKIKTHFISTNWVRVLEGLEANSVIVTENIGKQPTSENNSSLIPGH